jgi:hypothetical protein
MDSLTKVELALSQLEVALTEVETSADQHNKVNQYNKRRLADVHKRLINCQNRVSMVANRNNPVKPNNSAKTNNPVKSENAVNPENPNPAGAGGVKTKLHEQVAVQIAPGVNIYLPSTVNRRGKLQTANLVYDEVAQEFAFTLCGVEFRGNLARQSDGDRRATAPCPDKEKCPRRPKCCWWHPRSEDHAADVLFVRDDSRLYIPPDLPARADQRRIGATLETLAQDSVQPALERQKLKSQVMSDLLAVLCLETNVDYTTKC